MKAFAPPKIAVIHIQKIAPGPPRMMAVHTPMMFPVPTLEAVETIRAPNDEIDLSSEGFSVTTLHISPNMRICTPLVLIVK